VSVKESWRVASAQAEGILSSRSPLAYTSQVRYRLEVRLTAADVGSRVVIRWRRPSSADDSGAADSPRDEIADVLGILEAADDASFSVRKASGDLVTIPRERALAGKTVPPQARRGRPVLPGEGLPPARPDR
jgi:hypothetical protein